MSDVQDRINALQAATSRASSLEIYMLTEPIWRVMPHSTNNAGLGETRLVVFESRLQAILKPFGGPDPNSCAAYGQDIDDAITHEVAAWRLAHALGEPYDQLVPTCALRDVPGIGPGVLINWRDGSPDLVVFDEATAQVHAAAFWDALVGQQDRHSTNFRYDKSSRRLALIDHGFAFARRGDISNGGIFLDHRLKEGDEVLTEDEAGALERLMDEDLFGLRDFLAPDRVAAFEERANAMLSGGKLPGVGEF